MSPSRKVRGLALLGSLIAALVTSGLAAFSVLLWWVPLIAVALVVASLLWLRSGVQAEIAARRAARAGRSTRRSPRRPARRTAQRSSAPVASQRTDTVVQEHTAASSPVGVAEPELIETATVGVSQEQRPDAWQPVPVPPPTYTLKAKAERPLAPPAAGAPEATPTPAVDQGSQEADRAAAYGT